MVEGRTPDKEEIIMPRKKRRIAIIKLGKRTKGHEVRIETALRRHVFRTPNLQIAQKIASSSNPLRFEKYRIVSYKRRKDMEKVAGVPVWSVLLRKRKR
jgi:hypothetical protein